MHYSAASDGPVQMNLQNLAFGYWTRSNQYWSLDKPSSFLIRCANVKTSIVLEPDHQLPFEYSNQWRKSETSIFCLNCVRALNIFKSITLQNFSILSSSCVTFYNDESITKMKICISDFLLSSNNKYPHVSQCELNYLFRKTFNKFYSWKKTLIICICNGNAFICSV